ncbi:MAG: DUF418 domain-containing protein [Pseudomonadota bacterium]
MDLTITNIRYLTLDAIRGIAVMGILLMNIISFAMPDAAYFSPAAYGGTSSPDVISWAIMSVLVDGKMRGLFSVLFGASMLLVYQRAEAANGDGKAVHRWRMIWLLLFGLVHYYLIWFGDILTLYALCGLIGMGLLHKDEAQLRRIAIWLLSLSFVLVGAMMAGLWVLKAIAMQPGADPKLVKAFAQFTVEFGGGVSEANASSLALHRSGYLDIVWNQLTEELFLPIVSFFMGALEMLGLMALGMMFFRNGFLTGDWDDARYMKTMRIAYLLGIPGQMALALWGWVSGFDPLVMMGNMMVWSLPFHIAVMIGHAALAVFLVKRFASSALVARISAVGQAAFTNYLGTSILMTTLFYGYGFGLFGQMSRWQAYLVVPVVWAIMLFWSKPWLDRYRYGPLEWLWRSLARGQMQLARR